MLSRERSPQAGVVEMIFSQNRNATGIHLTMKAIPAPCASRAGQVGRFTYRLSHLAAVANHVELYRYDSRVVTLYATNKKAERLACLVPAQSTRYSSRLQVFCDLKRRLVSWWDHLSLSSLTHRNASASLSGRACRRFAIHR
jgi:hypothetical protein